MASPVEYARPTIAIHSSPARTCLQPSRGKDPPVNTRNRQGADFLSRPTRVSGRPETGLRCCGEAFTQGGPPQSLLHHTSLADPRPEAQRAATRPQARAPCL
jgi:hypothetical protein